MTPITVFVLECWTPTCWAVLLVWRRQ